MNYLVPARTYFDGALIRVGPESCVADIVNHTGDTLKMVLRWTRDTIVGFVVSEPDPQCIERLERYVGALPAGLRERIECRRAVVSSTAALMASPRAASSRRRLLA